VGTIDRRVLTVAIVRNCTGPITIGGVTYPGLSGNSNAAVIDEWVDMFLVEPVFDARGNGVIADSIYMEVIGASKLGGGGSSASQQIRRDVPYLVH
jgi:hypothetical protein